MESRGIQTRVGDESRRISKVNRDLKRQAAKREKIQAEIEAEQKAELLPAQPDASPTAITLSGRRKTQAPSLSSL